MEFHFRTRDIGADCDYPAIGWMPPLPAGADRLWRKFGNYGCAELPQMALSQKDGYWKLYLEGVNSGRTDSASGQGGRVIRMSLYLSGPVAEGGYVLGLLSAFLFETLSFSQSSHVLEKCFAELIKPGDPRKWRNGGETLQREIAQSICRRLSGLSAPLAGQSSESGWTAGRNEANLQRFLGCCRALLDGKASGCVVSLPYGRISDVDELRKISGDEPLIAALSGDEHEKDAPIRKFAVSENASNGGSVPAKEKQSDRNLKPFFIIALILAATVIFFKSCSSTKADSARKNSSSLNANNGILSSDSITNTVQIPSARRM